MNIIFLFHLWVWALLWVCYATAPFGTTKSEMETALKMSGLSDTEINEYYRLMQLNLRVWIRKTKLSIANSIWVRDDKSFIVKPDFSWKRIRIISNSIRMPLSAVSSWRTGAGKTTSDSEPGCGVCHPLLPSHLGDYSTEEAAAFTRRINQRWRVNRFTAIPDTKISLTSHRS